MKELIDALRLELVAALISLGDVGQNINEANEWIDNDEECRAALECVSNAADDATKHLRTISLKCEEVLSR
jgi:hypothetical protein